MRAATSSGPARVVAWLGGIAGTILVLLTPPGQGPDEPSRFVRAFAVAEGRLFPERRAEGVGDEVPRSLPASLAPFEDLPFAPERRTSFDEIRAALAIPLEPAERAFVAAPGAALLNPFAYAPVVAGTWIGRAFDLPPIAALWLARACDLAAGLALAWLAIRVAPTARWFLAALALAPMTTFLRSTASADVTTFGVALLFAALVLAGREGDVRRTALIACAAALGLVKPGYVSLALLVFTIPAERAGGGAEATRLRFGVLAATALAAATSVAWAHHFASPFRTDVAVDAAAQLRTVLAAPLRFAELVVRDAATNGARYAAELVGNLGWLDTPIPNVARLLYGVVLAVAATDGPRDLRARDRTMGLVAIVLAAGILALSQYMIFTPVGGSEIDGLQGRYYLPLAPAVVWLVGRPSVGRPSDAVLARLVAAAVAASSAVTLLVVWLRYYA